MFYTKQPFSDFLSWRYVPATKEELSKDSINYELNALKFIDNITPVPIDSVAEIILRNKSKLTNNEDDWGNPKSFLLDTFYLILNTFYFPLNYLCTPNKNKDE